MGYLFTSNNKVWQCTGALHKSVEILPGRWGLGEARGALIIFETGFSQEHFVIFIVKNLRFNTNVIN
jgi:hypothetical protein